MAKVEGDNLNSDELMPAGEAAVLSEEPVTGAAGAPVEAKPEAEPDKKEKEKKDEDDLEKEKGPDKLPDYLALGGAIFLTLIFVALALPQIQLLNFSTAIYLIGLVFIPYGVWLGRKKNTVYVVFLACVAAALLTAIYFLWTEIGLYNFDLRAQEAKQRVGMIETPTGRYV